MRVDELLSKINRDMFANINVNEILELRDDTMFDSEWIRVYKLIEEQKQSLGYSDEDKKSSDEYRKMVYKKIYEYSDDSEIAAYISDDFGLIYDCEVLGYSDSWIEALENYYAMCQIPCGRL